MHRLSTCRAMVSLLVLVALLVSCGDAQQKAAPGKGWVPLASGSRLYYEVAGTTGDTIVVPGAVF